MENKMHALFGVTAFALVFAFPMVTLLFLGLWTCYALSTDTTRRRRQ